MDIAGNPEDMLSSEMSGHALLFGNRRRLSLKELPQSWARIHPLLLPACASEADSPCQWSQWGCSLHLMCVAPLT